MRELDSRLIFNLQNSARTRMVLALSVAFLVALAVPSRAETHWRHGLSLFGDLKYPADFEYFDFVNPDAPKGGRARLSSIGSFDSLNPFTFKGQAAGSVQLIYDSLLSSSLDEPSSEYGLLAEAVSYPDDYSSVTYRLREGARWHDGVPVTPEDVQFSLDALRQSHPYFSSYYQNVSSVEITGERDITFYFDVTGNRELPQIVGQLPILPKHWWTAEGPDGPRSVSESTLEIPLGSGPYRIREFDAGRTLVLERVEDYWGADLPVNIGQNNFDEIRIEYFRDTTIALEAFKASQYDWRLENSSKDWATSYEFPAVSDGRVIREEIPNRNGSGMQSFAFNIRLEKFEDPLVREAFNLAFDFEWSNRNLFYGQYQRSNSFFSNSDLAATGLPGADELAILEPIRNLIPEQVFTTEYTNPVNESSRDLRTNLREATRLLREAGWVIQNGVLVSELSGEEMIVEFLLVSPLFERIVLPYVANLERLGVQSTVRTVDTAQYRNRLDRFDFDIVVGSWGQSLSPGNEQRDFWGSDAASIDGSRNIVGIESEAVDYLIDKIILAANREQLVAATRALDRVLLWNHYVVPQWNTAVNRTARWDRFGRPDPLPEFSVGFPTIWWWDESKSEMIDGN